MRIEWPKNAILCMILRITLDVNRKRLKLRAVSLQTELLVLTQYQNVSCFTPFGCVLGSFLLIVYTTHYILESICLLRYCCMHSAIYTDLLRAFCPSVPPTAIPAVLYCSVIKRN